MLAAAPQTAAVAQTRVEVLAAAQVAADKPSVQIGLFSYQVDGTLRGSVTTSPDPGQTQLSPNSYVYAGPGCVMGAGSVAGQSGAESSEQAWRFSGQVVEAGAQQAILELTSHRVRRDGQTVAETSGMQRLVLNVGSPVVLEEVRLDPSSTCKIARITLEARFDDAAKLGRPCRRRADLAAPRQAAGAAAVAVAEPVEADESSVSRPAGPARPAVAPQRAGAAARACVSSGVGAGGGNRLRGSCRLGRRRNRFGRSRTLRRRPLARADAGVGRRESHPRDDAARSDRREHPVWPGDRHHTAGHGHRAGARLDRAAERRRRRPADRPSRRLARCCSHRPDVRRATR